jgi:sulfite reductase (ferredoxin)
MSTVSSLCRLPDSLRSDLEQLREMTRQFREGAISAPRYQAFRVPNGVYEQRESGTYMLRVRLPAGIIPPEHMRVVAQVAEAYGDGTLHLTTRQDIQIHRVSLDGICPALEALADAGLSTKGGGGNTVRNIAACPHAGVCRREWFDVTPGAVALTEFMLSDPLSFRLPRKYKIAFSGCGDDCAAATVSDLGFIARNRDGIDGFAVYVGGGMGAHSRVGTLLEEFVPASQVCEIAEAVKRVFDKHGNRKNKHRARLRFLVEEFGFEAFRDLYRGELAPLMVTSPALSAVSDHEPVATISRSITQGSSLPSFDRWRETSVMPQRQSGYHIVEFSPPLKIIDAETLRQLANIIEAHGEGMLRATNSQSLVLRWVPDHGLSALHAALSALRLAESGARALRHVVACAGASTCRLGICLSRGLAKAVGEAIEGSGLALANGVGALSIHISGCPNACGRHPVGKIGLFGSGRRVRGHLVPHYTLQLGGHVEEGKTVLASGTLSIPARNVPAFLVEFLQAFHESAQYPDFEAFLVSGGRETAGQLVGLHSRIPDSEENQSYYFDWGAEEVFSLAGRRPGECGAGVFDLIEVDLASAAEALAARNLFAATALTARALLVTCGDQADDDVQSLTLFRKHFVEQGLVPPELHQLIDMALNSARDAVPEASFHATDAEVSDLLAAVRKQYETMGPSLRVAASSATVALTVTATSKTETAVDFTRDFRGVACPLNYVKTKIALQKLKSGQTLAVLLDEEGAKNVPASAANDGHEVLSVSRDAGHWRVLIRKKG